MTRCADELLNRNVICDADESQTHIDGEVWLLGAGGLEEVRGIRTDRPMCVRQRCRRRKAPDSAHSGYTGTAGAFHPLGHAVVSDEWVPGEPPGEPSEEPPAPGVSLTPNGVPWRIESDAEATT